ncbi:hypothetical protein [Sandarakinorhabdus sp.]|uniref:hypothetical protein n=1 Tax=Sandarakinorhabdus sp. TaxID=1916663 RepID=UPI00286DEEFE|nr:hypothetical protein [Sandarakinorhabdus sp.]
MIIRSLAALVGAVMLMGAAPQPADPVLQAVIANARVAAPASMSFERSTRASAQRKGEAAQPTTRTDRWDGKAFTLLSVNGKPPTPKEAEDFKKAASSRPVPGYYRLADILKAGAVRQADAQGRTVYRIAALPKGSINVGKDVSANVTGEFLVDTSGPRPYVSRARFVLAKPVSFFMVARIDSLDIVNDYRLGPDGRPHLARVTQAMSGAQFGNEGSTRSETSYTMLR